MNPHRPEIFPEESSVAIFCMLRLFLILKKEKKLVPTSRKNRLSDSFYWISWAWLVCKKKDMHTFSLYAICVPFRRSTVARPLEVPSLPDQQPPPTTPVPDAVLQPSTGRKLVYTSVNRDKYHKAATSYNMRPENVIEVAWEDRRGRGLKLCVCRSALPE